MGDPGCVEDSQNGQDRQYLPGVECECQLCRFWKVDWYYWSLEEYSLSFLCVHIVKHWLHLLILAAFYQYE